MKRKHHAGPEALLRALIEALETPAPGEDDAGAASDEQVLAKYRSAMRAVISDGPVPGTYATGKQFDQLPAGDILQARARLVKYLRELVTDAYPSGIEIGPLRFTPVFNANRVPGLPDEFVEGAPLEVLAFGVRELRHAIGGLRVRRCGAPDCQRIFVKTYRREFCSTRCQKRTFERIKRQKLRDRKARAAARRAAGHAAHVRKGQR